MNTELIYNTNQLTSTYDPQEPKFEPYTLVSQENLCLVSKVDDFDFGNPHLDTGYIASRLIESAKFHDVFGVAANQFGLPYRVFVAGSGEEYVAFFNPVIVSVSGGDIILPELDISNMGLQLHVKRPKDIVVQYQDFNGETRLVQFCGLTSRIIQQNIDRLNGIDFKSKVSKFNLERKQKSLNKKIKRFVRSNIAISK
jgi:peptide deformylase